MANTSYYLYQRYIKYPSNDDWVPVYPMEFSVSGDSEDPMPMVMKMDEDPACGGDSPTPIFPIYQWVNIPISEEYECSGGNKYYVEIYQVSYDNGRTWQNVEPEQRKRGSVYEYQSEDCGYPPETRTLTTATTCIGYDKYTLEEYQVSYDSGTTWETTGTSATTLIQADSPDCGYVPPTPTYRWYQLPISEDSICSAGTKYYVDIYQVSYDNGITWQDVTPRQTRRGVVYEYNSPDCIEYRWTEIPITSGYICDDCEEAQYRWTPTTGYVCSGTNKMTREIEEVSYDSGATWTPTGDERAALPIIEADSPDCGYIPPDYSRQYFTLVPTSNNSTFTFSNSIEYSLDSGSTWVALAGGSASPSVSLGQKIMWRKTTSSNTSAGSFSSTGRFLAEGNVMSLAFGSSFIGKTSLSNKQYVFRSLFSGNTNIVSAENMILPATTLTGGCYQRMFKECTNLTIAPELPAMTMAISCYEEMFRYCSSLTTAPELPATTLASSCYYMMFNNCTSLEIAPELPATTLASSCYYYMFSYSSKLKNVTCLATNITASNSTTAWLDGVAATGTFTKASSMNSWPTGTSGIPSGWTVQNYNS